MKRLVSAVAVCGALLVSSGVSAAEPAAGAAQPSARALELSKRLLVVTGAERRSEAMTAQLVPAMLNALPNKDSVPAEFRDALAAAALESSAAYRPLLIEKSALITAEVYSEDELEALVGFYESEMGRRILAKSEAAAGPTAKLLQEMMPQMMEDMQSRLCVKMKQPATCQMSDITLSILKERRK